MSKALPQPDNTPDEPEEQDAEPLLTDKQQTYLMARASGANGTEAARQAGYANPNVASAVVLKSPKLRHVVLAALEKQGATADFVAQRIMEGLSATQTVKVESSDLDEKGRVVWQKITEVDFYAREKYLRLFMDLTGMKAETTIKHKGTVTVETKPALLTGEMLQLTGDALLQAMLRRQEEIKLGMHQATETEEGE